eukprot:c1009_g1_i1 orf=51-224(+)
MTVIYIIISSSTLLESMNTLPCHTHTLQCNVDIYFHRSYERSGLKDVIWSMSEHNSL